MLNFGGESQSGLNWTYQEKFIVFLRDSWLALILKDVMKIKVFLILYMLFISTGANSQILGSEIYLKVERYIKSKPEIVNNIKNGYTVNSYGKCLAVLIAFEGDIGNGYIKPNDLMAFNLSVDAVSLGIARQEFLRKGIPQSALDASMNFYLSKINQKTLLVSALVPECRNLAEIFLSESGTTKKSPPKDLNNGVPSLFPRCAGSYEKAKCEAAERELQLETTEEKKARSKRLSEEYEKNLREAQKQ